MAFGLGHCIVLYCIVLYCIVLFSGWLRKRKSSQHWFKPGKKLVMEQEE